MNILFDKLNASIQLIGQHSVEQSTKEVNKIRFDKYYGIHHEKLRTICHNTSLGTEQLQELSSKGIFQRIIDLFGSLLGKGVVDPLILEHLALGIEAFSVAPADLPNNSYAQLYEQQIKAAIALTQSSLIQMDTGEGKTYVILPAAFALACKYHRIYIVCANEYLAWRDAKRTQPYWDFVGLSLGLCIKDSVDEEWEKRIIYTTLSTLLFKSLSDEISLTKQLHSITYGALILDEADAVLLDQAKINHSIVLPLRAESFNWEKSIELAKTLIEDQDIIIDRMERSANLTVEGERRIKNNLNLDKKTSSEFLILRYAIEIAYIAAHVVKENKDYIVENSKISPIDQASGVVQRGQTPYWVIPLDYIHGYELRPKNITIHSIAPEIFLSEFEHISGLSGTIKGDSLELFVSYQLPTVIIPPRKPRQQGLKNDLVYLTTTEVFKQVYLSVINANKNGRPILIGTQNISDAENLYQLFQTHSPDLKLKLLTGRNDQDISEIFTHAGQTNSIIIATQLAGRGVDIRLSEVAKKNGGLFLISIGHALTTRYDRQFLGRAGRQGDPWSAQFYCSLEDQLLNIFASQRISGLMRSLGLEDDEAIEHPWVTNAIKNAQQKLRERDFWIRRQQSYLNLAFSEIHPKVKTWFEQVRYLVHDDNLSNSLAGSDQSTSLNWLIERYIETNFLAHLQDASNVKLNIAKNIVMQISSFNSQNIRVPTESELASLPGELALQTIKIFLQETLLEKIQKATQINKDSQEAIDLFFVDKASLCAEIQKLYEDSKQFTSSAVSLDFQNTQELDQQKELSDDSVFDDLSLGEITYSDKTELALLKIKSKIIEHIRPDDSIENSLTIDHLIEKIDLSISNIISLKEKLSELRDLNLDVKAKRTPNRIAHWTVQLIWVDFLEESERIKHRIFKSNYSSIESYRLIYDSISAEWDKREAELPNQILHNLFDSDQPTMLDDLFRLEDNRDNSLPEEKSTLYEWAPYRDSKLNNFKEENSASESIVKQFIAQSTLKKNEYFSAESLDQLLNDFLRESPLNTLQIPIRIQTALERWIVQESNRGLTSERKKLNRHWIREFLIYLNQRNLIGSLPALRHKAQSLVNKLNKAMSETKTALSIIGGGAFLIAFILLSLISTDKILFLSNEYIRYFESLIFGGFLTKGIFTAPTFGSLILSLLLMHIVFPKHTGKIKGLGFEAHIALILQIFLAWLIIPWNFESDNLSSILLSITFFLSIIFFAHITKTITWSLDNAVGLSLLSVWLCYTSLFVTFSMVLPLSSEPMSLVVLLLLIGSFIFWRQVSNEELVLVSTRIKDSHMNREDINISIKIESNSGIRTHIYALLLSISSFELCETIYNELLGYRSNMPWGFQYVAIVSYVLTVMLMSVMIITQRLSPVLWESRLNAKNQLISGAESKADRNHYLGRIRVKLILKEIGFSMLSILVPVWYFWEQIGIQTGYPLSLLLIFSIYLFAYCAREFVIQLYKLLFSRTPLGHESLDLSLIKDESPNNSVWERISNLIRNRISLILTILIIIIQGCTVIIRSWDLIKTIGN